MLFSICGGIFIVAGTLLEMHCANYSRPTDFLICGGGEIRTHGPVAQTPVFKTGAIDHSATPPCFSTVAPL